MPVLQVPQSPFHGSRTQSKILTLAQGLLPLHPTLWSCQQPKSGHPEQVLHKSSPGVPTTARPPDVQLNKDLQHSGICVNTQASEEPGNSMGRWRKSLLSNRPKTGNWPTQTLTLNSNLSLISYSTSSILAPNIFHGKKSFQVLLKELAVQ